MESQVCETVVLMSRGKLLVITELQSQMYSCIPMEVNPSSYRMKVNYVYSSDSPIVKYRVEELLITFDLMLALHC